jgi:hypothetical protein
MGYLQQRHVQRDEVRLGVQVLQGHQLDAQLLRSFRLHDGVEADDAGAEAQAVLGHLAQRENNKKTFALHRKNKPMRTDGAGTAMRAPDEGARPAQTSLPMFPRPTTPTTLPDSSLPLYFLRSHTPFWTSMWKKQTPPRNHGTGRKRGSQSTEAPRGRDSAANCEGGLRGAQRTRRRGCNNGGRRALHAPSSRGKPAGCFVTDTGCAPSRARLRQPCCRRACS